MLKRMFSGVALTLLLIGVLTTFNIQPVKALYTTSETIVINADGTWTPPDAPITLMPDGITYKLTDDIISSAPYQAIWVQKDSIVLDGDGHTVEGLPGVCLRGILLGFAPTGIIGVTIRNVFVTNFVRYDIYIYGCSGCTVQGVTVTRGGWAGIEVESSDSITLVGNTADQNYPAAGIDLWDSDDNTLEGNSLTGNSAGIEVRGGSERNTLVGNTATGNGFWGWIKGGIVIDSTSTGCSVIGNTVTNNWPNGIVISSSGNTISANTVTSNPPGSVGILLREPTSSGNTLSDNEVTSTGDVGIALSWSSSNTLSGNKARSNGYYGITLGNSNGNTLSGNEATSNTFDGILLSGSSDNILFENIAENNARYNIYIEGGGNNRIFHNNFLKGAALSQAQVVSSINSWDDGYPSGGNYWTDYTGSDVLKGPGQDQPGADGIGDTEYVINAPNNIDNYPFMTIMFNQTGVGPDFTGTVVVIDGNNYGVADLPVSFMWSPTSTHSFGFQSPLVVTTDKRYVWTNTAGLSASQSESSITVRTYGSIIGNYKTQYLLTVLTDPAGLNPQPTRDPSGEANLANSWWYDPTTSVTLTAQSVTGYTFQFWDVDDTSQGDGVNPISVGINLPHTATAHYVTTAPPTYSVTIDAYCNTEAAAVSVSITMDGTPTGDNTPKTYTGLTGIHTFGVPGLDTNGHPFKEWSTGETTTTITVSAEGTYTAYYEAPPPPPRYDLTVNVVDDATSAPISGATVTVTGPESRSDTTDGGKVVFLDLLAGDYTVEASKTGYDPASTTISLNTDMEITLRLAPVPPPVERYDLTVQVRDANTGNPISGATVDVTGPESRSGFTDGTGVVQFLDLLRGDYTVTASKTDYNPASIPVTLTSDTEITITLTPVVPPPPGIPEFSFSVTMITALAAALYLALRKRHTK